MSPRRPPAWPGSPLAIQLMALLVGSLVIAQVVTLALSVLLPPAPQPEYRLPDVAAMLRGESAGKAGPRPLVRSVRAAPPALSGPGWLISEATRAALARQLGADARDVRLASYMPPPFAGAPAGPPAPARLAAGDAAKPADRFAGLLIKAAFADPAPGGGFGGRLGDGAAPPGPPSDGGGGLGLSSPGARESGLRGAGQGGRSRARGGGPGDPGAGGAGRPDGQQESFRRRFEQQAARSDAAQAREAVPAARSGEAAAPARAGVAARTDPLLGAVLREAPAAPPSAATIVAARESALSARPGIGFGSLTPDGRRLDPGVADSRVAGVPDQSWPYPERSPEPAPPTITRPVAQATAAPIPAAPAPQAVAAGPPLAASPPPFASAAARTEPLTDERPPTLLQRLLPPPVLALFKRPPAPFVQGDFVAAYKIADKRWAVVRPEPEPFPSAWQRRLTLWFALSFAIVGPLGLFYIRRIVQPLGAFAEAAEQLGRDPSAPAVALRGPAEVGRAARALNRMQSRIARFVADRTAMIGAISHDLRTPLTRMRFRLEEAPDGVRDGMLEEVEEMEAMITSVLDFLHQASEQGPRKAIDVAPLVEDVVEDFGLIGADVALAARGLPVVVEADALSIRRVVTNLVDNALKYGERARVSLRTEADEAVIEIADDGPGLPAAELDRVFQPFYRTAEAQTSGKKGVGLGLAACRSIARAHGGEVRFVRAGEGRSELRLPLVAAPAA